MAPAVGSAVAPAVATAGATAGAQLGPQLGPRLTPHMLFWFLLGHFLFLPLVHPSFHLARPLILHRFIILNILPGSRSFLFYYNSW